MESDTLNLSCQIEEERKEGLFTKYADSYDRIVAQTSYYKKLVNNVLRNLCNCKNVVDVGCGTGNITLRLAESGANVLAIDNNEAMLAKAEEKIRQKKLNGKVEFLKQDINELDLDENAFDGACMINVLYWLDKPYTVLDNIYAALKEGGIFVASGPKPNQKAELLIRDAFREFKHRGIFPALESDFDVFRDVNRILAREAKHFFATERLKEILLDFVGFSDVIATDLMAGYRTYLGQGYFLAVKKGIDYANLPPEKIKIRFAKEDEIEKTYKIRYHFTKERLGILESTPEQDAKMTEWDEYDKNSYHFIAEHNNKILAIIRFVSDSKELKLPADAQHNIDYLRRRSNVIWEPGRWIALPFAPRGTGRKVLRAGYEYAKKQSVTHIASIINIDSRKLYKNMGFSLDTLTSKTVNGYNTKAYIEIFSVDNPPKFFTEEIKDPAIIKFLASLRDSPLLIE